MWSRCPFGALLALLLSLGEKRAGTVIRGKKIGTFMAGIDP
jgi:hypothetical protein